MRTTKPISITHPVLAGHWHYSLNNLMGLGSPDDYTYGSHTFAWWWCGNPLHSYKYICIKSYMKTGCNQCHGKAVIKGVNDFKTCCPEGALNWDYDLNNDNPDDYMKSSYVRKNWKCHQCGHEWIAPISRIMAGHGCPECGKKKMGRGMQEYGINRNGSFASKHPLEASEWCDDLNDAMGLLKPDSYSAKSSVMAWFHCGDILHEPYMSRIKDRANGHGCPQCSGRVPVKGVNDFETMYPWIARQWYQPFNDYEHLGTPDMYTAHSTVKAWFWCGNPLHSPWKATIASRTTMGRGCPQCAGNIPVKGVNDFETMYPWIARQWYQPFNDYEHLGTPDMYTAHSTVKAWFWCGNPLHSPWKTSIGSRTGRTRKHQTHCPMCMLGQRQSTGERDMISTVCSMFPMLKHEIMMNQSVAIKKASKGTVGSRMELDLFIPSLMIAIEYNGEYYHSDELIQSKVRYDSAQDYHDAKLDYCMQAGIELMAIWDNDWNDNRNACIEHIKNFINSKLITIS